VLDAVSRDELRALAGTVGGPCVSLFLPTHRAGPDSRPFAKADVIRFKNLLREAERTLRAVGTPAPETRRLLGPARARLDDDRFWRYQAAGLAVFVSRDRFRIFRVPRRLPELVVIARRFHLKPLLALLTGDGLFYILALSLNGTRLLEATRDGVREVGVPGMPRSLAEALRYDDPERQLQFHTATPAPPGRRPAVFHGHGAGTEDHKTGVLRYCQQVDRAVAAVVGGAPVVLAAVEYVQAIYRQASSHGSVLGDGVAGSPDAARSEELHARAWPLVEPRFQAQREAALARYRTLRGTGKTTSELGEALALALQGRIDVLAVALDVQRWGHLDRATGAVELRAAAAPGDEELLDVAAEATILNGGTVYAVEPGQMPHGGDVAAVLRY
jgi:hypothetical protein